MQEKWLENELAKKQGEVEKLGSDITKLTDELSDRKEEVLTLK